MVFNATSTIFQQYCRGQFYLMQETRVSGENHRPVASHCQTLIIYLYQIYILVTIYFTMILYNIGWCVIFPCCFSFLRRYSLLQLIEITESVITYLVISCLQFVLTGEIVSIV